MAGARIRRASPRLAAEGLHDIAAAAAAAYSIDMVSPTPSSVLAASPCSICQGREFYFLSPWRSLEYGVNGWHAQPVQTCAHVPERGFLSRPAESDVLRAPMSLRVCAGCGASVLYTDPAAVRAMLAAGQPGVSHVRGEPGRG